MFVVVVVAAAAVVLMCCVWRGGGGVCVSVCGGGFKCMHRADTPLSAGVGVHGMCGGVVAVCVCVSECVWRGFQVPFHQMLLGCCALLPASAARPAACLHAT